jgi:hypothetical protein
MGLRGSTTGPKMPCNGSNRPQSDFLLSLDVAKEVVDFSASGRLFFDFFLLGVPVVGFPFETAARSALHKSFA